MPLNKQTHRNDKENPTSRSPATATENLNIQTQRHPHLAAIIQRARLNPGSLTPQHVQKLQGSVGNRVINQLLTNIPQHQSDHNLQVRRDKEVNSLIQTSMDNAIIQLQPDFYLNKGTGRYFHITFAPGEINADETEMSAMQSKPPPHYGYLIYTENPSQKSMALKTLLSDPEEGSGLGVLLMWMMADLALKKNYKQIEVLTPAKNKLAYYARFGFDIEKRQEEVKKQYLEKGLSENDLPDTIAVGSAVTTPGDLKEKTAALLMMRWKPVTLPPKGAVIELK